MTGTPGWVIGDRELDGAVGRGRDRRGNRGGAAILTALACRLPAQAGRVPGRRPAPAALAGSMVMLPFQPDAVLRRQEPRLLEPPARRLGRLGRCCARSPTSPTASRWQLLVLTLIAPITGFSISLILSVIYGRLINQRPLITWRRDRARAGARGGPSRPSSTAGRSPLPAPAATPASPAVLGIVLPRHDRCSAPGRRCTTRSTTSSRSRSRPTGSNGSRRRRPALSSPCCATSSIRISCSTP